MIKNDIYEESLGSVHVMQRSVNGNVVLKYFKIWLKYTQTIGENSGPCIRIKESFLYF